MKDRHKYQGLTDGVCLTCGYPIWASVHAAPKPISREETTSHAGEIRDQDGTLIATYTVNLNLPIKLIKR